MDSHETIFLDDVLNALYEAEKGAYTSYTLAQKLRASEAGSPEAALIFGKARDLTEALILRGFVRGVRSISAVDGVYFNKLKLTDREELEAIRGWPRHRLSCRAHRAQIQDACVVSHRTADSSENPCDLRGIGAVRSLREMLLGTKRGPVPA